MRAGFLTGVRWASTVIPALQQNYSQYQHILSQ